MEIDAENLRVTELTLGPPGSDQPRKPSTVGTKRRLNDAREESAVKSEASGTSPAAGDDQESAPVAKAQVVGWPPVRAYRKNSFPEKKVEQAAKAGGLYVKVSMVGAPYLRKIDLKMYKGYRELREALDVMFKCFSSASSGVAADGSTANGADQFAIAYEDKDGDLMRVGDVPWDMFISSCKKLRIMRGSEAR